eukprot:2828864-Prymnesium_polylepis.1
MLRHIANDPVGEPIHLRGREREAAGADANTVGTLEASSGSRVDHGADLGGVRGLQPLRRLVLTLQRRLVRLE